ncbi:MAG TPA: hypothetical protein VFM03_05455 [Candidatus Limnocylindria bacterium]|jgi:hypothetical protein|nr:hypothetical protein [Candidatus Limnocylindria bacterium]
MRRRTIRYVAAGLAAAMAAIYFLIGLGVLQVVNGQAGDPSMLGFGASAGGAFLLGAILLAELDRRWLWIAGALLQVMVVWGYFAIAPDRDPAFEVWGLTLRVIQLPLLAALVWLALRPSDPHPDALVHLRRTDN